MIFSEREIREILISWFVLSLAFNILFHRFSLKGLPLMLLVVGTAFVFHELAHKFVAQSYGLFAEYRLSSQGLMLALLSSLFGFVIAAPGAVYMQGYYVTEEVYGKTALAGPLANILVAIFGLILFPLGFSWISMVIRINLFIGLFNLIPFPPFDGSKIMRWNSTIWGLTVGLALVLFMLSF